MPTSWGDTMVYGARYSRASFVGLLEGVLDANGLLPSTFTEGRRNRDIVGLRVTDHNGHLLFDSSPGMSHGSRAHMSICRRAPACCTSTPRFARSSQASCSSAVFRDRVFHSSSACSASPRRCRSSPSRSFDAKASSRRFAPTSSRASRTSCARRSRRSASTSRRCSSDARRPKNSGNGRSATSSARRRGLSHLVENVLRFSTLAPSTDRYASARSTSRRKSRPSSTNSARSLRRDARRSSLDASDAPPVALDADALRHIRAQPARQRREVRTAGTDGARLRPRRRRRGVTIAVDDEGPGVAERERERIWRAVHARRRPRRPPAAAALASRSCAKSPTHMAARRASNRRPAAARGSSSLLPVGIDAPRR